MKTLSVLRKSEPEYYGGDGDCPHCHAVDALGIPAEKGVLHWVEGGYTVHGVLDFRECEACARRSYAVSLGLIKNPDVTDQWSAEYFWSNEPKQGFTSVDIVNPKGRKIRGLPEQWRVSHIETSEGVLERHFFGPFPDLKGRGAWALNGSVRGPWQHAAFIICRVGLQITARKKKRRKVSK